MRRNNHDSDLKPKLPVSEAQVPPSNEEEEKVCFTCGKTGLFLKLTVHILGHFSRECPTKVEDLKAIKTLRNSKACFQCGKLGHSEIVLLLFVSSHTTRIAQHLVRLVVDAKNQAMLLPNVLLSQEIAKKWSQIITKHGLEVLCQILKIHRESKARIQSESKPYLVTTRTQVHNSFGHRTSGIRFESYNSIPVVVKSQGSGQDIIKPIAHFNELELGPILKNNIQLAGKLGNQSSSIRIHYPNTNSKVLTTNWYLWTRSHGLRSDREWKNNRLSSSNLASSLSGARFEIKYVPHILNSPKQSPLRPQPGLER